MSRDCLRAVASAVIAVTAISGFAADSAAGDPVIAAAGDIACSSSSATTATKCRQRSTSDLLVNAGLSAVLPLGDAQYQSGSLSGFTKSYHPTWGRVKPITFPAAGNHEYKTAGAKGYFDYFNGAGQVGGAAGNRGAGYYSYDIGAWHLIALNSSDHCLVVSCAKGSSQETWLKADLAAHPRSCTLAYWHHPRFNSGHGGNATFMQALFQDLYDADADVVLGGHAHDYERFAPQNPAGKLDNARGIRQFVVGTGGAFFTALGGAKPNSQVRNASTYGVLMLTLRAASYDWKFVPEAGKKFTDSGTERCHGAGAPPLGPGPLAPAKSIVRANSPGGVLSRCTISGTAGDDVLIGTSGRDVICGLAGNDRIRGRDGDDVLLGGRGRDVIFGGRGDDVLHGNFEADVLRGQSGNDRIGGEGGRNRIYGNAGNDVLDSSKNRRGGDRVDGGRGRDTVRANRGDRVRSARRR